MQVLLNGLVSLHERKRTPNSLKNDPYPRNTFITASKRNPTYFRPFSKNNQSRVYLRKLFTRILLCKQKYPLTKIRYNVFITENLFNFRVLLGNGNSKAK